MPLLSCKRRMWLLMRNTDAEAISGKQWSPWEHKPDCGETSHKKESPPLSFVPKQRGSAVFSGKADPIFFFFLFFFLRGLVRFLVVLKRKAEHWKSCMGFLLTGCYGTRWRMSGFLRLPLFPGLWGDKTPPETKGAGFYGWPAFHHSV